MSDDAKNIITAIGAIAELCGELKRRLIQNGFTEREALDLVGRYLTATIRPTNTKEDN